MQGTTGVGFALIVAPILGLVAPELLPTSLLLLMVPLNAYVAYRERAALDRPGATWITVGRFAGTFGGVWILSVLSGAALNMLTGTVTVLAAAVTLLAPQFTPQRNTWLTAGVITGVTETSTGIGGPPLALVYQHQAAPVLRSTLAFCFLVGQLMSLAFLAVAGRATLYQLGAAAMLLPPLVVGALLSRFAHQRVHSRYLRGFVLAFAVVSGTVLLLRT